ncbi:MAG: CHAD domain-containing protein [Solirubrobacteraceae bacterium]
MAYRFEPDETVGQAFGRIAAEQLLVAETPLRRDLDSDPIDAIHTARKAIKKERALLRLMRGAVHRGDRRQENAALRDAARRLSGARDAEVMIQTLDGLAERYAGQLSQHEFAALRERLPEGPSDDSKMVPAASRTASELAAARERMARWTLEHQGWAGLEPGLRRTYARGITAFGRARDQPTDEHLHEWRKRVKDHWYGLRLLAAVCGPAVHGEAKDAHALADLLGDDHDMAVLRERLPGVASDVAADVEAVLGLLDHRRAQLQAQAMALGERVYADRPKAFVRRIRVSWRAGRRQHREARQRNPADLAEATRSTAVH